MTLPQMQSNFIEFALIDAVAHLKINRPQAKNALNLAMYQDMVAALQFSANTEAVRAVCITGAEGQFTSGNDLKDFLQNADISAAESPIRAFIGLVASFTKPIVVGVEGVAYGIGTTLLLHCDHIIAHPQAAFCLPFIKLGLVPEFASSQLLASRVGPTKAKEWLMGGEPFAAQEALQAGLLNELAEAVEARALEKAQTLANLPKQALAATKSLMNTYSRGDIEAVIEAEIVAFSEALKSAEFKEAATAFFEKRPPKFY